MNTPILWRRGGLHLAAALLLCLASAHGRAQAQPGTAAGPGAAQPAAPLPEIFRGADLALGMRLLAEHRCSECHARRVGGDGSAIYKPLGRIQTAGLLRGMVDYCSTELNLGLFPEEVTAVAAVLQRDHYRLTR